MSIYEKISEDIKGKYFTQNYSNDGQRFVAWYVLNILRQDENQTKDAITDGADDKQIDAIVVDDDKQVVHIVQGKFYNSGLVDADPLREVLSSWLQLKDLVHLQIVGNGKLQSKLPEVAKAFEDEYEVCFELIITHKLTKSATADLELFQRQLAKMSEGEDFDATLSLVDEDELARRYELENDTWPQINHSLDLGGGRFLQMRIAEANVIVAAVPLKEAVKIKGINDGSLFQKNVRQSLGNNTVNKKIKETILGNEHSEFFFFHNGITAICNKMELNGTTLSLTGLSVVNGCQSLTTIHHCSETVKKQNDSFVLFRFYEITQGDRADKISINTNSQSAVKQRDLRSNDKRVLTLKKQFEQCYTNGYFITKRGQEAPASKDKNFVIDLSDLCKYLIAWYSQRPNISYGETKIFDKYFDILFKKGQGYKPEDIQALNDWMREVKKVWINTNPLGFNETLLAMKAYAPFHHLYAVSMIFAIANNQAERVPSPQHTWEAAQKARIADELVTMAGQCLSVALENAVTNAAGHNKIFNPANWVKSTQCLTDINSTIRPTFTAMRFADKSVYEKLNVSLQIPAEMFSDRLRAD